MSYHRIVKWSSAPGWSTGPRVRLLAPTRPRKLKEVRSTSISCPQPSTTRKPDLETLVGLSKTVLPTSPRSVTVVEVGFRHRRVGNTRRTTGVGVSILMYNDGSDVQDTSTSENLGRVLRIP